MSDVLQQEQRVLGAMLVNIAALTTCLDMLATVDFAYPAHRDAFEAMRLMRNGGIGVDVATLARHCSVSPSVIAQWAQSVPAATNAAHYAKIVRDDATRRLLSEGLTLALSLDERDIDVGDLLRRVDDAAFAARQRYQRKTSKGGQSAKDLAGALLVDMDSDAPDEGIPYPYPTLQKRSGGYRKGELVIIGGYTSDGKSIAALQCAEAACRSGRSVGYWSLEMPASQIMRRLAAMGGLSFRQLRMRSLGDVGWKLLVERAEVVSRYPLTVYDSGSVTPGEIRAEQARRAYDVVVVDHLHRFARDDRRGLEQHVVALKNIAMDHDCAVIALAQLSRRPGYPMPTLNMLRDTAVLEQEADAAWFVWRRRDDNEMRTNDGALVVGKMREAAADWMTPLDFNASSMSFSEPTTATTMKEVV